ncbi:MAG: glycosyltransferase family 39 protein [Chloroflexi bacterium]|nr:glycosyltransferase family 39 protein [Chloroflexota bacterium]
MSLAALAIYVWAGHYWLDLIDEGYFVYLGYRIYAGDLPYRDFDTYYTPGIFYLFAWTFDLAGVSVEPIRVLMSGMRILWGVSLYLLARRVTSWPFAILPLLAIAAVDAAPMFPEPHPSWPSMLATFLTIEVCARHQERGGRRWLILAGVLGGLAMAFKQNIGAFVVLAIGAYLLLRPRPRTGWLLAAVRVGYLLLLAAAATVLIRPGLSGFLAAALWLPLLGTVALAGWSSLHGVRVQGWMGGLRPLIGDGLLAGIPFFAVTIAWLVPLTLALGLHGVPWGLFVGQVNQGALILPLDPPSPGVPPVALTAVWLPVGLAFVLRGRALATRRLLPAVIGLPLLTTLMLPLVPLGGPPAETLVEDPSFYPWLGYLDEQLGVLFTYLPGLAAWGGLAVVLANLLRGRPAGPLIWYLLAGSLAALSLYPRVDTIHALFAGPPLLVTGAAALGAAHRLLAGRAHRFGQVAVYLALLVLPVAAVAPHAYWRYVTIVHANPRAPTPPPYVDLGLERAQVRLPENIADSVRGAVRFVQDGTPPGLPFFAYPVSPMFHFLADRPNPTRHNHFIAGALTPDDLQEVIRDLDQKKPRYILWDHGGVTYFKAELTNRVLHDYIWNCYAQVENYTPYLILERRCP